MADNLVYEESLNTEIEGSEFISKKWVYVNDNNSQNYTSQIVIDSTPLSNAGGWISWQESFIVMPLVVELTSTNTASLPLNTSRGDYSWAFKSGFWQMINSMTVEFNNQNVIQQTPFLNVFRSFKANTSFSQDDLFNVGSTTGFYPDNAKSWTYCTDFSLNSVPSSYSNNVPYSNNNNFAFYNDLPIGNGLYPYSGVAGVPSNTGGLLYSGQGNFGQTGATGQEYGLSCIIGNENSINNGMLKRQGWYNYNSSNPDITTNIVSTFCNYQNNVNNNTTLNTTYRSGLSVGQCQAGRLVWTVYAKLRLKDLADFFEKMPLLKGSTIRFYINTNQAITNFTTTLATINGGTGLLTDNASITQNSVNVIGGLTNPLMVASANIGQGASCLPADTYQLSVSIFKNNFTSQNSSSKSQLNSCRLYAPVYTMNPLAESKYLSLAPTKKVMYKDIFQYQFNNIEAGGVFNFLVSNGIANICSVLCVPFISKNNTYITSAGATVNTLPVSSTLNPFSPSPANPDPITITNFNILVSGVNLFLNNEQYDFEAFLEQLNQSNQLNGGLTTGLASGLVNEDMFSSCYRYYYGDCSRILPSEKGVSRSIQIVGQNVSAISCDMMVFVEFMREITIDIATGARIE
jgi:hypothetical protein